MSYQEAIEELQVFAGELWDARQPHREFKAFLRGSKTYPDTLAAQAHFLNGMTVAYKHIQDRVINVCSSNTVEQSEVVNKKLHAFEVLIINEMIKEHNNKVYKT